MIGEERLDVAVNLSCDSQIFYTDLLNNMKYSTAHTCRAFTLS
jgi:hypothetical protein